jgi:hypothetical protein
MAADMPPSSAALTGSMMVPRANHMRVSKLDATSPTPLIQTYIYDSMLSETHLTLHLDGAWYRYSG